MAYDLQGTCHFLSNSAAIRYYRTQETDAVAVRQKIEEGGIKIGKPPARKGSKIVLIDEGTRYAYETK
jgi:hypothetical protein